MPKFVPCPNCGANLDHSEQCHCQKPDKPLPEEKRVLQEYAALQKAGLHPCPRCGQAMLSELVKNTSSIYADIYICRSCAEDEVLRKFTSHNNSSMSLSLSD